ncbi:MAG: hypothetical protein JAY74_14290 [Candidatus Thiodiazotropha taylori]|nr:hypothetical protein [Candidatus Thiodiazotropha taylori]
MDEPQISNDDHSGNRAENGDSDSENEVFFNRNGSTRQAETQGHTQYDTMSMPLGHSVSANSETEQRVAAASLMQLNEISQQQTGVSSTPNLLNHVHQGSMVSSHSNPNLSMRAQEVHNFNRGDNNIQAAMYSEANMRNTVTGLSNALLMMQQQQAGMQQQQVSMEIKQDSISGTLTNVLSLLQELTKKSQNSSQNNCANSADNTSTDTSLAYCTANVQSTSVNTGCNQVIGRAQGDETGMHTEGPTQLRSQYVNGDNHRQTSFHQTGDNYSRTSLNQPYSRGVVDERQVSTSNTDTGNYYRSDTLYTQSYDSEPPSRSVQFRGYENTVAPYGARQSQTNPGFNVVKLPPFNGKEDWKVWVSRFEAIAERRSWSDEMKLDNLLPKLQGKAGEFVFTQLPRPTLSDYGALIKELNSRFRVVETKRTFAGKFSQRTQKPGETAEEYAAELKRLYAKAYTFRDENTRQEDLVRRFLDGLRDSDARFEIEYNKEPDNIDEAVYHAVNYLQTKRKGSTEGSADKQYKRYARRSKVEDDSSGEESQDEVEEQSRVCRLPVKKQIEPKKADEKDSGKGKQTIEVESLKVLNEAKDMLQTLMNQMQMVVKDKGQVGTQQHSSRPFKGRNIVCYCCQEEGHVIRDCPKRNDKPGNRRPQGGARPNGGMDRASGSNGANPQPLN